MVHNTKKNHYAFRDGDWLLVDAKTGYLRQAPASWNKKHKQPKDDGSPIELYNLADDIGQRNNLASKHPEKAAEMKKALQEVRDRGHSAPRLN